ncbi:hypothetical protein NX059_009214 [Plenodomus lindquistii]|nr:hypothetical protein NX059_009214 [Plenodomus lindquistii]
MGDFSDAMSERFDREEQHIEETVTLVDKYITAPSNSSRLTKTSKNFWIPLLYGAAIGTSFASASIIILGFLVHINEFALFSRGKVNNHHRHLGSEINGIVPEVPYRRVQFWNDSSFVPTYGIVNGLLSYNDTMDSIEPSWADLYPGTHHEYSA